MQSTFFGGGGDIVIAGTGGFQVGGTRGGDRNCDLGGREGD